MEDKETLVNSETVEENTAPQAEESSEAAPAAEAQAPAKTSDDTYDIGLSDNKSGKGMGWYVVHTYSGYEQKVKANIEKATENRHLEDKILDVRIPMEETYEVKNNTRKKVSRKLFPGYVLIHMDADDNDAWYVVRNTRGVTGFVGPGSKPVPLTPEEERMLIDNETPRINLNVAKGDHVSVVSGVWQDTQGIVERVDEGKQVVVINVDLFGRATPVEISFTDIKKI